MRAICCLMVGASILSLGAAPEAHAATEGDGLTLELPRLQGRVRLGMSSADAAYASSAGSARLSGASVLGDYYFFDRSGERAGDTSGFRATTGVYLGSRLGLWGGQASPGMLASSSFIAIERHSFSLLAPAHDGSSDASSAVPYLGLGYSGASVKGGLSFSADLGLMALNPGNAVRLGRVFGGTQNLDDLLRDLRFSPVLQIGVSYSF